MDEKTDWYPSDAATERLLYGNIDAKIDGFAVKYPFLTVPYLAAIHVLCQSFIEAYDKVEQNRATAKQMTAWFTDAVRSQETNEPVAKAPVFQPILIPAGALRGFEQQCRAFARLLKNQPNYDVADGLDLMVERGEHDAPDLDNYQPEMTVTAHAELVVVIWLKSFVDALELQYRAAGTAMWQPADKSTEKRIEFAPPLDVPGVPQKFEFRAIGIVKNKRIGQWSEIFVLTVG